MIKFVVINGVGTSGKDTFIDYVKNVWERKQDENWVVNFSTIFSVKEAVNFLLEGKDEEKTDEYRTFLSEVKEAWIKYNDGPTKQVIDMVKLYQELEKMGDNYIIFIHCREIPEIEKIIAEIKSLGESVYSLLIDRPGIKIPKCEKDNLATIKSFQYDDVIINESLEELEDAAENYVEKLLG